MNNKLKEEIIDWIKTICMAGAIAMVITLVAKPTVVSGQSMYPTLENKDYLIINRLSYNNHIPDRGDIIVFETELRDSKTNRRKNLVKRVIALPGEHLVIKDNSVCINGEQLNEDYLSDVYTDGNIDIIVPNNQVFTMGDNREHSDDSRKPYIGTIDLDDIVGKVALRAFPFDKIGLVE